MDHEARARTTILIVEDSPTQALKLEQALASQGFPVRVSVNGRQAVRALEEALPSLVITDIHMPEMDGYELCRRIKDHPQWRDLPVILLTSLSDPQDILMGLECGADNFIVKPYTDAFLLSRIEYVVANWELRRQGGGKRGLEVVFGGRKYRLSNDRTHSIDLLLSTYETAVQKNVELLKAKELLERQSSELREKNAQMEEELAMARELQVAFLPRHFPVFPAKVSPEQSAIQFCHRYATTTELGGDFFDILALSDVEGGVFICDVMGHGVRAALVAAIVRGLVEELKPLAGDPGRLMTAVNHGVCGILKQTVTPLFATAFYLVADLARGELRYASAGHPAPYRLRREMGRLERLDFGGGKPGPALGIFERPAYVTGRCGLAPRDMVMLFTDGIYEVEGADGGYFTKEQLMEAVERRLGLPAPQLFDELITEITGLSATGRFEDDMCLVGLEVTRLVGPGGQG